MRRLAVVLSALLIVLTLVLVDRLALRRLVQPGEPDATGFVGEQTIGRVLRVQPDAEDLEGETSPNRPHAWRLVACHVLAGRFAGRVVLCSQPVHPRPDLNIVITPGDIVVLELGGRDDVITFAQVRKPALRYRGLLWLLGLLAVGLLALGGWRSARNLLAVAGLVALLFVGLFPLLAKGAAPVVTMAVFSAVVVAGVLLVFYGWDRKALAALAGTAGALVLVGFLSAAASRGLQLTGLDSPGMHWLSAVYEHEGLAYDYRGLLLAGLLVAVVGVAIDTSVSIAAGIEELYRAHPNIAPRAAFASGLAIGRDVMGVCATTFVFASIGVRLPVLLVPAAADLSPAELVNTEAGCVAVLRILLCGVGLLATAPLTTLCAVAILRRGSPAEAREARRGAWRWIAAGEAVLALVLVWGVAWTQPHEGIEAPVFESVASGDFDAVTTEGDMLLAAWDYPRAILLLWRAADAGIEPAACHTHAARLFYDYQAYLGYHERGGLPESAQEYWTKRSGTGGRGWAAYALAELRTAQALEPDDFAANYGLGQLLCSEDRVEEGIPYLRAALRAQPDHVELLLDLAGALTREGENEEARELADRLRTLAPEHPRLKQLLDVLREGAP